MSAATGGAGTPATLQLIHYTPIPIPALQNSTTTVQNKITRTTGKPAGFWYAYNTDWKATMYNIRDDTTRPKMLYKYTVELPASLITEDFDALDGGRSRKMIYRLTAENYKEFFAVYHKKEYKLTPWDIVSTAVHSGSLELILYDKYRKDLKDEEIMDIDIESLEEGSPESMIVKIVQEGYNPAEFEDDEYENSILEKIAKDLQADEAHRILDYSWSLFWEGVCKDWGGIEFPEWITSISEAPIGKEILPLPWTSALSVTPDKPFTTGILFKPKTFLAENGLTLIGPETIVMGGKRRTRNVTRRQKRRQQTKRRRTLRHLSLPTVIVAD